MAGHPARSVDHAGKQLRRPLRWPPTIWSAATRSIFLTQLDTIEPVDPRNTQLMPDNSSGYRLSKLFLEAQLRQMPPPASSPTWRAWAAFKQMNFQRVAVEWALRQLRPRLLLADSVGLGKTIELGMILVELLRRGRANRILVLARKSMLSQFQSELWNRFASPWCDWIRKHRQAAAPHPGQQESLRGLPSGHHQHRHAEERGTLPALLETPAGTS